MENKKVYEAPCINILDVKENDIITTSVSLGEWDEDLKDVIEF